MIQGLKDKIHKLLYKKQLNTGERANLIFEYVINKIPLVKIFENREKDKRLQNEHKELLRYAMVHNNSKEVLLARYRDFKQIYKQKGTEKNVTIPLLIRSQFISPNSFVVMHNHPNNKGFSQEDIEIFCTYRSIYILTAVCHNGEVYAIKKTPKSLTKFNLKLIENYQKEIGVVYMHVVP